MNPHRPIINPCANSDRDPSNVETPGIIREYFSQFSNPYPEVRNKKKKNEKKNVVTFFEVGALQDSMDCVISSNAFQRRYEY